MEHLVFAHDLTKADRVVLETLATDYSDHLKVKDAQVPDSAYASASDTEATGTTGTNTNTNTHGSAKGGVNKDAAGVSQRNAGMLVRTLRCPLESQLQ